MPSLLRDREETGLGGGQVHKQKSVINRLVREQSPPEACVRHICRTFCLAFFLKR